MNEIKNMNSNLFAFSLKNIKTLIIVTIIAGIASIIFSSPTFIAPKFQSNAVVYPSNLGEYSEESPIEQMMQWFDSREIKDRVIKENNLAEHYDIDSSDKLFSYYMIEEYNENISITETRYESAEINVLDTDPEKAFQIVNSIINNFNKVIRKVHKKRALEDLNTEKQNLALIKHEIDSVASTLQNLRDNYDLIDYSVQAEQVTRGYLKTIEGANKSNINVAEVLKLKENIEKKGVDFIKYNTNIYDLLKEFAKSHVEYSNALSSYKRVMTYTNVVSHPHVPVKKVYPIRWIIVLLSSFGSFFFTFVLLLFINRIKH